MTTYQPVSATLGVSVGETSGTATLTLQGPISVMEDIAYTYTGRLAGVEGIALPGQTIQFFVDGVLGGTAVTITDGSYSFQVTFDKPAVVTLQVSWAGGSGLPP